MSLTEDTLSVSSEPDYGELRTCECGNYQTRRCSSKGAQRGWKTPKTSRFVLDARSERRARSLTDCCLATPTKRNLSKASRVGGAWGIFKAYTLSAALPIKPSVTSVVVNFSYNSLSLIPSLPFWCVAMLCFSPVVLYDPCVTTASHLCPSSSSVLTSCLCWCRIKKQKKTVSSSSVSCLLSCFVLFFFFLLTNFSFFSPPTKHFPFQIPSLHLLHLPPSRGLNTAPGTFIDCRVWRSRQDKVRWLLWQQTLNLS